MEMPEKDEQKIGSLKHCKDYLVAQFLVDWRKICDCIKRFILNQPAEPNLKPASLYQEFSTHWITIVTNCAVLAGVVALRLIVPSFVSMGPLFVVVCIIPALVINRRWGTIAAIVCTVIMSLMRIFLDIEPFQALMFLWNVIMRFLFFETYVVLFDYFRRQASALPPTDG